MEGNQAATSKRGGLWNIISAVVTGIAIVYIVIAVRTNWATFGSIRWTPGISDLVALALFVIAVPISGWLWGLLLTELAGRSVSIRSSTAVHIQAWLFKYLPGQLGSLGGKVLWGKRHDFPASTVTASFAYETVFHFSASLIVGLPAVLLAFPGSRDDFAPLLLAIAFAQVVILGAPHVMQRLGSRMSWRSPKVIISAFRAVRFEVLYIGPRLINAAGFVLIAWRFGAIEQVSDVPALGAVYVLAGLLGLLAFLVPSGLGVREAAITALLAPSLGEAEALSLAVSARIIATAADLVLVVMLVACRGWLFNGQRSGPQLHDQLQGEFVE